ncbi:MAG: nitrate reductase [Magnetococcales bacterium]|nr:nitrate reductase [Magnetococcales bacterium]
MLFWARLLGVMVLLSWLVGTAAADSNQACLRCHAMATLALHDQQSGQLRSLFIDPARFQSSNHGRLACIDCHLGQGIQQFPHGAGVAEATSAMSCRGCHPDQERRWRRYRFDRLEEQFRKSAHARLPQGQRMDCFSCHDPHQWQLGQFRGVDEVIQQDNGLCLRCHGSDQLASRHRWLPQRALHWRSTRCIDCHTPAGSVTHAIQPALQAERQCEACHNRDSILLSKLYRYRMREEVQKAGFINSIVLNDAYVMGMTRHQWIDRGSVALVSLTVLTLAGHAAARWLASRQRRRRQQHDLS